MSSALKVATLASIVLAGALAYSNSFAGVLVLDDPGAITLNPTIRSLAGSLSPPPGTSVSGRPTANLTFAINYAISETDLWSYHALNLLIHLAAALTLFGVVRRSALPPPRSPQFSSFPSFTSFASLLAWSVALLWVVHPLHTEAVTYVVQRIESLAGLFLLLTLYCAIRAGDGGTRRWDRWSSATLVSCGLGMATKETMVVAPIVVWLWYWTFRGRAALPRVVLALPATWLILIALVMGAPRGETAGFGLGGWTPWSYLVTQAEIVVHYLRLVLYPSPLVFHYAWPKVTSLAAVAPQALLLFALAGASTWGVFRRHPLGFAGAFFFLVLAPSSSIVPVVTQVAAEHRMYLATAAVLAVIAACISAGVRPFMAGRERAGHIAACVAVLGLASVLGSFTYARNRDYASAEALWHDTVQKQPGSPRGQLGYALELFSARRFAEAESHARIAATLEPHNPLAHRTLGFALANQGKTMEALTRIQRALELFPDDVVAKQALEQIHAALRSAK